MQWNDELALIAILCKKADDEIRNGNFTRAVDYCDEIIAYAKALQVSLS